MDGEAERPPESERVVELSGEDARGLVAKELQLGGYAEAKPRAEGLAGQAQRARVRVCGVVAQRSRQHVHAAPERDPA